MIQRGKHCWLEPENLGLIRLRLRLPPLLLRLFLRDKSSLMTRAASYLARKKNGLLVEPKPMSCSIELDSSTRPCAKSVLWLKKKI